MDKKMKGALVALVGSLCMGGAQVMSMESRIAALEEAVGIEPESAEDDAAAEATQEPDGDEEAAEAAESSEE
tara:strand:- start:327 stop:542 length:216 start_codon:yes stop_codon:yes gene_type:complete